MKKIAILSAVLPLALGGCATVVNGPNQDYEVKSKPEGASVKFSNGMSCTTPCEVNLPRKYDLRAEFRKDGYKPTYAYVESRTGAATFGNVLAGGIIGAVVDSGNGSNNFLYPKPLYVELAKEGTDAEAQLLDKDGKVKSPLMTHNDSVRADVEKRIGPAPDMGGETAALAAQEEASVEAEAGAADEAIDANGDATAEGMEMQVDESVETEVDAAAGES